VRPLDTLLRDGDRVELYRPLRVDPKEARRLRYKRAAARKR
jgi:putative ubiquitin-RnfH superfamily antitoxin RatB of RatAB toxin-antitoxin module